MESIEKITEVLRLRMKDFYPDMNGAPDLIWKSDSDRHPVERKDAPVPSLIYFILVDLLKFRPGWRGDKTHWVVTFRYKDIRCFLALEKFGLRLYTEKGSRNGTTSINPKEIINKLHRAIVYLEKALLEPFGKIQIAMGNVTVVNQYYKLDGMYQYFRKQAVKSYKLKKLAKKEPLEDNEFMEKLADEMNIRMKSEHEGFYNTIAMIDAFFSRIEHLLVFCLPFAGYSPSKDDLIKFIGLNWSYKYKRVLGLEPGLKSKKYYDRLDSVKEIFRNTFAHGGFEKAGASLYFHFPNIGAIPASLTSVKNSPHFHFFPLQEANFQEVCSLFDEVDEWLEKESLPMAIRYAKSGLNISFDEDSITNMLEKAKNVDIFDEWLEAGSNYRDMIENADY